MPGPGRPARNATGAVPAFVCALIALLLVGSGPLRESIDSMIVHYLFGGVFGLAAIVCALKASSTIRRRPDRGFGGAAFATTGLVLGILCAVASVGLYVIDKGSRAKALRAQARAEQYVKLAEEYLAAESESRAGVDSRVATSVAAYAAGENRAFRHFQSEAQRLGDVAAELAGVAPAVEEIHRASQALGRTPRLDTDDPNGFAARLRAHRARIQGHLSRLSAARSRLEKILTTYRSGVPEK